MTDPEPADDQEAEHEGEQLVAVVARYVAVSTLFLAASATLSSSGRISNVMAMATTASVKNFIRSAVPAICGSAMTGG